MNIGRPLQYDPEHALNSAMSVFWQQGYTGTTLEDLLVAMNLSKSSFYQAYQSKHSLFLSCISQYLKLSSAEFNSNMKNSASGKQFIIDVFETAIAEEKTNPKGCFVSNTATEFAQSDLQVTKLIKQALSTYKRIFKKAIVMGQEDGSIKDTLNPDQVASFLVTSLNGLRTMVKAGEDQKTLRGMVRMVVANL